MRDALKHDPSILRDAVAAMQADDGERQQAEVAGALRRIEARWSPRPIRWPAIRMAT